MSHLPYLTFALVLCACRDANSPSVPEEEPAPFAAAGLSSRSPIPGQYIVVFRGDLKETEALAKALAGKHSGKLKHTYKSALKGMAVQLSDSAAAALRRDPTVEYIEQDRVVHASAEIIQPGATWGIDRIDQRLLPLSGDYRYAAEGTGVRVYILDTGINYAHTEFGGRAVLGFDVFGEDGSDCYGHGTHVAGTVGGTTYGVAKEVQLVSVRVLDCVGDGTYSGVIAGVDWVTANRVLPAVANMSLGGDASAALNQAVTNSIAAGVTYAVSAGNNSNDACGRSPASTPNALTVGASTVNDVFAAFSNRGPCVDITAPGGAITSAWIGSPDAARTTSGTSMASPHVAGTAALYLSLNPIRTPSQVAAALIDQATPGVLTSVPTGTANLLLHSSSAVTTGSWATRAQLPSARRSMAVGTAKGLLYAIGGANSAGTVLTRVQSYDPSSNAWTTRASLPSARQTGNGAATITGNIYVAGGQDGTGALTRTLYRYSSSTGAWSTRANMPVVGGCGGSAAINGKVYVFSGCTRSRTGAQIAAGLLHRYDPSTNTWATLRPAPAVHFQPVVAVLNGRLYVVGGNNQSSVAINRVDVYDPASNTWSTRTPMPTARVSAASAAVAGKLYVVSGRNGPTYLNTVEVYDPVVNSWSTRAAIPTARGGFGVGVINNLLYAVGGRNAGTTALKTNERLTP